MLTVGAAKCAATRTHMAIQLQMHIVSISSHEGEWQKSTITPIDKTTSTQILPLITGSAGNYGQKSY